MKRSSMLAAALSLLGTAAAAKNAAAAPCAITPNTVILSGSSAVEPLIKKILPALATADITLLYNKPGSCEGVTNVATRAPLTAATAIPGYMADGTALPACDLPAGSIADVAVSDVFPQSCVDSAQLGVLTALPAGFHDEQGPIQAMTFVVPKASTQQGIVAEEAYYLFKQGTVANIAPWISEASMYVRKPNSGTRIMISSFIKLPAGGQGMKGTPQAGAGDVASMLRGLTTAVQAEPAIGILAANDYDAAANRTALKELFYQHFGQIHGYLPDSKTTSFDKKNVREGRYAMWGPTHWYAPAGADGKYTNMRVQKLVDVIQLKQPLTGVNVLDAILTANVIPQCAMKVQRTTEAGDMTPYTPPPGTACGCAMDAKFNTTPPAGCTACTADAQCGALKCSNGFCE